MVLEPTDDEISRGCGIGWAVMVVAAWLALTFAAAVAGAWYVLILR